MQKIYVKLGDKATMFWDGKQKVIGKQVVQVDKNPYVARALTQGHLVEVSEADAKKEADEKKAATKLKDSKEATGTQS